MLNSITSRQTWISFPRSRHSFFANHENRLLTGFSAESAPRVETDDGRLHFFHGQVSETRSAVVFGLWLTAFQPWRSSWSSSSHCKLSVAQFHENLFYWVSGCTDEFDLPDTPTECQYGANEPVSINASGFPSLDLAIASSQTPKICFSLVFLQSRRLGWRRTTDDCTFSMDKSVRQEVWWVLVRG